MSTNPEIKKERPHLSTIAPKQMLFNRVLAWWSYMRPTKPYAVEIEEKTLEQESKIVTLSGKNVFYQAVAQGKRSYQEDRSGACLLENVVQERCLHGMGKTIQNLVNTNKRTEGCGTTVVLTGIFTHQGRQSLYTVSLGDSYAFLLTRSADHCRLTPLNWIHSTKDELELARIAQVSTASLDTTNGSTYLEDTNSSKKVNVTRSIGDARFSGLSREPSFTVCELDTSQDVEYFVLLLSDGVADEFAITRNGKLKLEKIIRIFLEKEKDLSKLATALIETAYAWGSTDNLSALCVPVPTEGLVDNQGIMAWVLDGHGGDEVSDICHKALPDLLKKYICLSSGDLKKEKNNESKTKKNSAFKKPLNELIDTLKKDISKQVQAESLELLIGKKNGALSIQKLSTICLLDAITHLTQLNITEIQSLLMEYVELIPLFEQFSWFDTEAFEKQFKLDRQQLEETLKQINMPLQNSGLFPLREPIKEKKTTSPSLAPPKKTQ